MTEAAKPKAPTMPTGADETELRAYVGEMAGVPAGYRIGVIERFAGIDAAPMTIEILPPGNGRPLVVRLEEEHLATNHRALRLALSRDTDGVVRGGWITGTKAALEVYGVLCALAAVPERLDPRAEAREWISELRERGVVLEGQTFAAGGVYDAIQTLRHFGYGKAALAAHAAAVARGEHSTEPRPPILLSEHDEREYIAVGQLGTFVRHHLGCDGTDRVIVARVTEIGGMRVVREAWNVDRTHKPRLVLVQLPPREVYSGEEEAS